MLKKEEAKKKISELVERFEEQYESYKKTEYNETLTRRDFIDPFFKALGWDVDNENGYAESYREVIHEDKIKVGKATKAPDYSFRLVGGKRLFFVEAKKPHVVVKDDIIPAYQIRRYGWSAKLPISIITDFEEFAIYDCTKKPFATDKTSVARIKYLTFRDYIKEFDFIWDTFSQERVLKGSFDKFILGSANKKGTATVDKEFLESLDRWRTYLATSISWNNKTLDEDEINFAVQQIIDRIIFLRIAEDRGVEAYGSLKLTIKQGDYYQNLFHQFELADDKYNSGLFDFHKDKISKTLSVDNKVLKTIINELYYPESPYEFSVLSVEILGSAYEQFLGKQIKVDNAHRVHIEEKPEVRKAGGVYYTPQYIVEYIVKNTVGRLIENKTPKEVDNIKIVDPACGSGSFLIGAYQYLLDWHKNFYSSNGKISKGNKSNPLTPQGNLTTAEKKRILINNIFGVDIDLNAVEVTKLSLLLKCMEGETEASIASQFRLFNERVLPTLDNNIRDGNSLIDTDFYTAELDLGFERRIKPFNWKKGFPDIRNFDIVIGNPPYGALFSVAELNYFKKNYVTSVLRGESYLLFIERGLNLLKLNGLLGFIIPDTLLNLGFTQSARDFFLQNSILKEIVGLPSNVFTAAVVDTIIVITEKADFIDTFHTSDVLVKTFGKKQAVSSIKNPNKEFKINTKGWFEQKAFNLQANDSEKTLLSKIEMSKKNVQDISEMFSGIKSYEVGKGKPAQTTKIRDEKPYTSEKRIDTTWQPFYDGKHIGRYQLFWKNNNWIKYGEWLAAPRDAENFEGEKILIRKITGQTLIATYIPETSYCNTLLFVLKIKDKMYSYKGVLSILNSKLIGWYFRKRFQISDDDTFPQIMIRDILQFPIPEIQAQVDTQLNKHVDQIMQHASQITETTLESKISHLQSKIDYSEEKIDQIVYQLYELTEEEIKIVEAR